MNIYTHTLLYLLAFIPVLACVPRDLAPESEWQKNIIKTNHAFDLVSFAPANMQNSNTLVIYIEGDGFAWRNRRSPSRNPTPKNPVAFDMANNQSTDNVNIAYLARACQYIDLQTQPRCKSKYWTSHRFAPEVIDSMNAAIGLLKVQFSAIAIKLVGYSGGGAVAALVAARRDDVVEFVTIAGNLDTEAWTTHHKTSPLSGSINPADYWRQLADTPQTHYVGSEDEIMPANIAQSYASRFPGNKKPKIILVDKANHQCCWTGSYIGVLP